MVLDLNDMDSTISAIEQAIPALFLMMNSEEKESFKAILESVCARNDLRKGWFSEWMRSIISESDAVKSRIEIKKGGINEQRCDNQADN